MKIEDIQGALGIGKFIQKEDCIFLEHSFDCYREKICGHEEMLKYFTGIQSENYASSMRKVNYIFTFANEGGAMRFYELYKIKEELTAKEAIKRGLLKVEEYEKIEPIDKESNSPYFDLEKIETPGNLEKRLLISLLNGQKMCATHKTYMDKEVLAIEKEKKAMEFSSYEEVYLSYNELKKVIEDEKWKDMLSRFGGVYLIHDKNTGKNYVGSASGKKGILQRWQNYAENPTGGDDEKGNKWLVELLNKGMHGNETGLKGKDYAEKYFVYSILQILPIQSNKNGSIITKAESRWKEHLGTRKHGLNAN